MAFGATPRDSGGIPISEVYVPGSGMYALQGSSQTNTDGSGNTSAPACFARSAMTVFNRASALSTANSNSGDLAVGPFSELAVDVSITGNQGTSPTIQFFIDRKGVDGVYYNIWGSSVVSVSAAQVSTSIGVGLSIAQAFGSTVYFRWIIGGSSTPGFTFSVSIIGK